MLSIFILACLIQISLANELLIELDHNPLSNIGREFEFKMKNSMLRSRTNKKSKFAVHLEISLKNENRKDLLSAFLAEKIFQYGDKINLMTIPEYRNPLVDIKVLKIETEKIVEKSVFGSTSCRLDKVANSTIFWKLECENMFKLEDRKCKWKKEEDAEAKSEVSSSVVVPVPICPWHWNIITRNDRFPFKRASAVCNCAHCQARTIYDSKTRKISYCKPEYVVMLALFRESLVNDVEKWKFILEEVPNSCTCSLNRLKPFVM